MLLMPTLTPWLRYSDVDEADDDADDDDDSDLVVWWHKSDVLPVPLLLPLQLPPQPPLCDIADGDGLVLPDDECTPVRPGRQRDSGTNDEADVTEVQDSDDEDRDEVDVDDTEEAESGIDALPFALSAVGLTMFGAVVPVAIGDMPTAAVRTDGGVVSFAGR